MPTRCWGTTRATQLYGFGGSDYLRGYGGHDYLSGGDGNDYLQGDGGTNTLIGGAGARYPGRSRRRHLMHGGRGSDTYWVDSASDLVGESPGIAGGSDGIDLVNASISFSLVAGPRALSATSKI